MVSSQFRFRVALIPAILTVAILIASFLRAVYGADAHYTVHHPGTLDFYPRSATHLFLQLGTCWSQYPIESVSLKVGETSVVANAVVGDAPTPFTNNGNSFLALKLNWISPSTLAANPKEAMYFVDTFTDAPTLVTYHKVDVEITVQIGGGSTTILQSEIKLVDDCDWGRWLSPTPSPCLSGICPITRTAGQESLTFDHGCECIQPFNKIIGESPSRTALKMDL